MKGLEDDVAPLEARRACSGGRLLSLIVPLAKETEAAAGAAVRGSSAEGFGEKGLRRGRPPADKVEVDEISGREACELLVPIENADVLGCDLGRSRPTREAVTVATLLLLPPVWLPPLSVRERGRPKPPPVPTPLAGAKPTGSWFPPADEATAPTDCVAVGEMAFFLFHQLDSESLLLPPPPPPAPSDIVLSRGRALYRSITSGHSAGGWRSL